MKTPGVSAMMHQPLGRRDHSYHLHRMDAWFTVETDSFSRQLKP